MKKIWNFITLIPMGVFLVTAGLSFSIHAQQTSSQKSLTINTVHFPPLSTLEEDGFEDIIAKEMYKRIGFEIELNTLPAERVLVNVNEGIDDGLLSRIGGLARLYPNLVQFEEDVIKADYIAFSKRTDIKIQGWDSLKPYNVGIINGWKILEQNVVGTASLVKVKNSKQLFTLLELDRVDLVIFSRFSGLHIVRERGLQDVLVLEPPLATRKRYFYLNKKHKRLASRASDALKNMKKDGTYQQIFDRTLKSILND